MTVPDDSTPLGQARDWLREQVREGHDCPLCGQFAKVYLRKINSSQAKALLIQYRHFRQDWAHLPELRMLQGAQHSNEEPKLRYWGLLEEESDRREDGGRAGWWRITDRGRAFALGTVAVPKYALVYNGRCLGFEGDETTITDALGDRFDYDELMRGGVYE